MSKVPNEPSQIPDDELDAVVGGSGGGKPPSKTGLPDHLKAGVESLSCHSMNDVKVHFKSPAPTQAAASAYAHGNTIHVAPTHQSTLPHEATHTTGGTALRKE